MHNKLYRVKDLVVELQAVDQEAVILTGCYEDYGLLFKNKEPLKTKQGELPYSKGASGEEMFEDAKLPIDHPYVDLIC